MRGITRQLTVAKAEVQRTIKMNAAGGPIAAGLANEGYAGGYLQALYDVEAALRGVPPSNSRYWPTPREGKDG